MKDLKPDNIVFLNGKFISKAKAFISPVEPGFLYGWGIFETMRSYNHNILYLDQHLKRLKDSCRIIDMQLPYSLNKIKSVILKTVELNMIKDAYVRATLWKKERNNGLLIIARPYKSPEAIKYKYGFKVTISTLRQNESSFLSQIKSMNYLLYQLAYKQAKDKGFDEAIILNNRGIIAECSRANIFLVKDKELFTPSLDCGCLAGITRNIVFDLARDYNIKLYESSLTVQDLREAGAAFLTNSLIGIMPVTYLDMAAVAKGNPDKITLFLMAKYNNLLKWNLKK